ncbi:helix-turn-helix transcriptional regulator [Photobacterium damselae subsp. damselae]|uniref:helix-turn-helix domain-containing protein n=1 Tax=Photobacterium damselae TaxID=38293 RepID=UPI00311AFBFD
MNTLGQRIAIARKSRNPQMSQKELAEKIGMAQSTFSRLESGEASSSAYLVDIAMILEVNIEWLTKGLGVMRSQNTEIKSQLRRLEKTLERANLSSANIEMIIDDAILTATKLENA